MLFNKIWELLDWLFCHFFQKHSTNLAVLKGFCKKAKLTLLLFYWVALTQFSMTYCPNIYTVPNNSSDLYFLFDMEIGQANTPSWQFTCQLTFSWEFGPEYATIAKLQNMNTNALTVTLNIILEAMKINQIESTFSLFIFVKKSQLTSYDKGVQS